MNTYVISDIHGCYGKFMDMLKLINFSEDDQLILAGDYIDRGSQNVEMLNWLENSPDNVLLLKGNHDEEFAECINLITIFIQNIGIDINRMTNDDLYKLHSTISHAIMDGTFDHYGTLEQILSTKKYNLEDLLRWKSVIDNMGYYFKTKINGEKYIIVHAGYTTPNNFKNISDLYSCIEEYYTNARDEGLVYAGVSDTNIIFGHTPTIAKTVYFNNGMIFKHTDKNNCNYYNIDCGCAYYSDRHENAHLACLRLEDKKEFYI